MGLKLLTMMQGALLIVVNTTPPLKKGTRWPTMMHHKTSLQRCDMGGKLLYGTLPNKEVWHLDKKYCYQVNKGWDTRVPNHIASDLGEDSYQGQ
jgi:hypothetical protein